MAERIPFDRLDGSDLIVNAIYEGGTKGDASDDVLAKLLRAGNQGGFRIHGRWKAKEFRYATLYTSGAETDWPDRLDANTGLFTYYGDNRSPGKPLHQTSRRGNELLRFVFEAIHAPVPERARVPPFFVFGKAGRGRDREFLGLAVPGAADVAPTDDLVAVWRTTNGERFQNYKAVFTILNVAEVKREWITELEAGEPLGPHCPEAYRKWVEAGKYLPLEAPATLPYRTTAEQLPQTPGDAALVEAVYEHFKPQPHRFEALAIDLWKMSVSEDITVEATRPSKDSGRDAFGKMYVGPPGCKIPLDFSLEAKCFKPGKGCGVAATARLISRLRSKHFGVFVTTSHVGPEPSAEIHEDQQPIVVIAGRDIAELLKLHGKDHPKVVTEWLEATYPLGPALS